jgi:hypothetical protein
MNYSQSVDDFLMYLQVEKTIRLIRLTAMILILKFSTTFKV